MKKLSPLCVMSNGDQELYNVLSKLRLQIARKANLPAFTIFSNKTLTQMAKARPVTKETFLKIHGIGPIKWEKYGQLFLDAIVHYCAANGISHENVVLNERNVEKELVPNSNELAPLLQKMLDFYHRRNWEQFHSPKNLVMALASEVGELAHSFRWLSEEQSYHLDSKTFEEVHDEIADVFQLLVHLSYKLGIDPIQATQKKLTELEHKYRV